MDRNDNYAVIPLLIFSALQRGHAMVIVKHTELEVSRIFGADGSLLGTIVQGHDEC